MLAVIHVMTDASSDWKMHFSNTQWYGEISTEMKKQILDHKHHKYYCINFVDMKYIYEMNLSFAWHQITHIVCNFHA